MVLVLQIRTSVLIGAKKSDFSKIYGVSARKRGEGEGGLSPCGQERRGQFFAIFCGCLLWTASYNIISKPIIHFVVLWLLTTLSQNP